jgi:hypothetical protein
VCSTRSPIRRRKKSHARLTRSGKVTEEKSPVFNEFSDKATEEKPRSTRSPVQRLKKSHACLTRSGKVTEEKSFVFNEVSDKATEEKPRSTKSPVYRWKKSPVFNEISATVTENYCVQRDLRYGDRRKVLCSKRSPVWR